MLLTCSSCLQRPLALLWLLPVDSLCARHILAHCQDLERH